MSAPTIDVITAAVEFANASEAAEMALRRVRYARRVLDAARQQAPCPTVATRVCLVCGGPSDADECDTCVIDHDARMKRAEDI